MPDKIMNWDHPFFPWFKIEAEITEADPATNETPTLKVRTENDGGFAAVTPLPVVCAMGAGSNPDVFVFGGTVDQDPLDINAKKESTWIVSNTGPGAIDHPTFSVDITVTPWGVLLFSATFNFPCP